MTNLQSSSIPMLPKKDPSLFLRLVKASPGQFTHCLFLMIIAVSTLNFAVIVLLHPQDNQFDWLPSYQRLLVIESAFEPTKRVGIGSKHFRSEAHKHNVSSDCHGVASDAVLEEWKGGKQTVCSIASPEYTRGWFGRENNTVLVEEYVLRSWEYEPTFVRYQVGNKAVLPHLSLNRFNHVLIFRIEC